MREEKERTQQKKILTLFLFFILRYERISWPYLSVSSFFFMIMIDFFFMNN